MSGENKIKVPEDFPGTGDGGELERVNPAVEADPDVIAEEKKLRLSELRWKRYIVGFKGIAVGLQTFRAEAVSVITGVATLVIGWYQIKKYWFQGRAESRAIGKAEGQKIGRASERRERREDKMESLELSGDGQRLGSGTGSGYGAGSGKAGSPALAEVKKLKALARQRAETVLDPGVELMTAASDFPKTQAFDPMNPMLLVIFSGFIWSIRKSWVKRKNKLAEEGGRRNED